MCFTCGRELENEKEHFEVSNCYYKDPENNNVIKVKVVNS